MNLKDTINGARKHGAHRPFGEKNMVRNPDRPVNPDALQIVHDAIPDHKVRLGNKYHELFAALALQPQPRAVKAPAADVMKVANSLRKWIKAARMDAHVRTIAVLPTCSDRMGRVWLCDGPQTVVSNAYKNKGKK